MALSAIQQRFVDEYLVDLNATQAYIRAGYSENGAGQSAHALLRNPEIQEAITEHRHKLQSKTGATVEFVLSEWFKIASADPNELVEHRMCNCRHCWGVSNLYQHTDAELRKKRLAYDRNKPRRGNPGRIADPETWSEDEDFEMDGGAGFDRHRKPNPECPECRGVGEAVIVPRDTRELSPAARALYAGVKVNASGGWEIKTHSKDKALESLAKHLGMFVDRQAIVNPDGSALEFAPIMFVPVEAKPRDPEES